MALFSSRKRPAPVAEATDSLQVAPDALEAAPVLPAQQPEPPAATQAIFALPEPLPLATGLRVVGAADEAPPAADPAPQGEEDDSAEDMRNLPLGTLLYRHGLVGEQQLEEALTTGMTSGERLGEILIGRGLVSEDDIARMLAVQQGLPFLQEHELDFDAAAAALLPVEEARALGALPVSFANASVLVVTPDPSTELRQQLEHRLHRRVSTAVVGSGVFERLVARAAASVDETSVEETPVADAFEAPEQHDFVEEQPEQLEQFEPQDEAAPFEEPAWEAEGPEPVAAEELAPESWGEAPAEAEALSGGGYFETDEPSEQPVEALAALEPEPVAEAEPAWDELAAQTEPQPVEPEPFALRAVEEHVVDEHVVEEDVVEESVVEGQPTAPAGGRVDELGAQHEASVERIHGLLGQIEAGATTFADLRRRLGELGENLRATEESLGEREQRLAELGRAHEEDQHRIDELVGQLRERDEALGELGGRVEELSGRLVTAEERLDEREHRLTELDSSLTESAARVEELFRQVELRDQSLSGFADKLDQLARRFGDAEQA